MASRRVEEIERALQALSAQEFAAVARRVRKIEQERRNLQLELDACSGRPDFCDEANQKQGTVAHPASARLRQAPYLL